MKPFVGVANRVCRGLDTVHAVDGPKFVKVWVKLRVQSCMTLTDMRLTDFMGLTEKSATTKLFIQ